MSLADKIKEARKITVNIGDKVFTGQRATTAEFSRYYSAGATDSEIAKRHISGWENVVESDLYEDGGNSKVPFTKELFDIAIDDQPEWYTKIAAEVCAKSLEKLNIKVDNEKK